MTTVVSSSQDLVAWVRSPERREQLAHALPEDVGIDLFERLTATALLQRPDLLEADRTSLWFALLDAAKRGIAPDGRQGVINVYNTKIKQDGKDVWIKKAQFIPMIAGVRDELARFGWALRTTCIYANDEFAYDASADIPTHRRAPLTSERGEIVGAWAQLVRLRDGFRINEVMDRAQIDEVRVKAKGGDRLWDTWYDRACEKTVGHRVAKKAPLDPKERERIDLIIASELEPGEAAELLYGPQDPAAVHAAASVVEVPPTDGGETRQAEGEPGSPAPPPATGPDDEPGISGEVTDEALQALALAAAGYVPPNGKFAAGGTHGPKTIREILDLGADGEKWLRWALEKIETPPEYAAACWSFARIFCPAIYQEALAKKELQ